MRARSGSAAVPPRRSVVLNWSASTTQRRQPRTPSFVHWPRPPRASPRARGQRYLSAGYNCVSPVRYYYRCLSRFSPTIRRPQGPRLPVVAGEDREAFTERCTVRSLNDPGPIQLTLPPPKYATALVSVAGLWCLQMHEANQVARGVLRSANEAVGDHDRPNAAAGAA